MASDPRVDIFMPIYVGDLLADTLHLNTEQFGAFMFLLLHQWRVGHFTEEQVAQITRLAGSANLSASSSAKQELSKLLAPVMQLFARDDSGALFSRRADTEKSKWTEKKRVFIERARKGGEAKAKKWRERKAKEAPASSTHKALLEPCTSPEVQVHKDSAPSLRSVAAAGAPDSASSTAASTENQPEGTDPKQARGGPAEGTGDGNGGKAAASGHTKPVQPQQLKPQKPVAPGKNAGASDPRHTPFKTEVSKYWSAQNPGGRAMPWNGSDAAALSDLLKGSPDLQLRDFQELLQNRAASDDINPADLPRSWLRDVMRYHGGALDRFNKKKRQGRVL